ncbi:prespore protein Dp87-like [Aplysia californica]|uniref:Prespore protein Dp87-like n=1 Tax=Aplysia californica TaxID=6500 RepID=A0ABM0JCH5_APLCA|nr:prespore protein Dp87-like [Aplysia californica]
MAQECRVVEHCQKADVCSVGARCIWQGTIDYELDDVCRHNGYLEALLISISKEVDNFREWKCKGPDKFWECPPGSACVDDGKGGGTCCMGRPDYGKPGLCPVECRVVPSSGSSHESPEGCLKLRHFCGYKSYSECNTDVHCGKGQKCQIQTACSYVPPPPSDAPGDVLLRRRKRDMSSDLDSPMCQVCVEHNPGGDCEPFYKCVEPGVAKTCAAVRCGARSSCQMTGTPPRPVCSPRCTKKCRSGFKCQIYKGSQRCTDRRPKTCDGLQCPHKTQCKMIKDTCGPGSRCDKWRRRAKKAECVPVCSRTCKGTRQCKVVSKCPYGGGECEHNERCVQVRKPGTCPKCRPGRECALRRRCRKCKLRHVCVLSQGRCPRLPKRLRHPKSRACRRETRRQPTCADDSDCRQSQKCCSSKCGRQICRYAKRP